MKHHLPLALVRESLGTRLHCTNYFNYRTTYHIGNGIAWLLETDQDLKCLILAIV